MLKTSVKKEILNISKSLSVFNCNMSKYTSFGIGGMADVVIFPRSINEVCRIAIGAANLEVPLTILGAGSNTLVKDQGIRGIVMVISNWCANIQLVKKLNKIRIIRISSGVKIKNLCSFSIKNGLSGANFALGIPGSIGGAIAMNAGTSKGSISDILHSVTFLNRNGEIKKIFKKNLIFSNRKWFQKKDNIILECELELLKGDDKDIRKNAVYEIIKRKNNQPTFTLANAGCFFKNPKVGLSAGKLMDEVGLKGKTIGGASISNQHANFIINTNKATAKDVLKLADLAHKLVYKYFKISLEPEVKIIGN